MSSSPPLSQCLAFLCLSFSSAPLLPHCCLSPISPPSLCLLSPHLLFSLANLELCRPCWPYSEDLWGHLSGLGLFPLASPTLTEEHPPPHPTPSSFVLSSIKITQVYLRVSTAYFGNPLVEESYRDLSTFSHSPATCCPPGRPLGPGRAEFKLDEGLLSLLMSCVHILSLFFKKFIYSTLKFHL